MKAKKEKIKKEIRKHGTISEGRILDRDNVRRFIFLCDKTIRDKAKYAMHAQGKTLASLVEKLLDAWYYNLISVEIKEKDYTLNADRKIAGIKKKLDYSNIVLSVSILRKTKVKIMANEMRDSLNDVIESLLRYYNKDGYDFTQLENLSDAEKKAVLQGMKIW